MADSRKTNTDIMHNGSIEGSDELFTVPNFISFIRIVLIIPFVLFFLADKYILAFSLILASGISDALDGFLARKLNQISKLGKMLDPIADKLTLVAVVMCMGTLIPELLPLVIILVVKDLLMLAGGYYLLKRGIVPPAAKWYGKIATIIFYISVVFIVFMKAFMGINNPLMNGIILGITSIAMMFALVKYSIIFFQLIKANKNSDNKVSEMNN